MKKYLFSAMAIAFASTSVNAEVITINYATKDNGLSGPISGTLSFDTQSATRISYFDNLLVEASTYSSPSFKTTYNLFGETINSSFMIQSAKYITGDHTIFFYTRVPDTSINLNLRFDYDLTAPFPNTNLPESGYESASTVYVAFYQELDIPGVGPILLPIGQSQADYAINYANAVPEPATWAMMIGGFGMVGGALRRRTARPSIAVA